MRCMADSDGMYSHQGNILWRKLKSFLTVYYVDEAIFIRVTHINRESWERGKTIMQGGRQIATIAKENDGHENRSFVPLIRKTFSIIRIQQGQERHNLAAIFCFMR